MAAGKRWTRDELLIALNLYHKLTFGQMHARQPVILDIAARMGRSSGSLAMKLCNFASLDPALKLRGIRGLSGTSALDENIWSEFHENIGEAVPTSETAFRHLFGIQNTERLEVVPQNGVRVFESPSGPTEKYSTTKVRLKQDYFRQIVLNNFNGCCGVTGLPVRELLIASHILPWSRNESERLKVENGLCLSRLHDAAFDAGLIGFDTSFRLRISPRLKAVLPQQSVKANFAAYEGQVLNLPEDAVMPDGKFLGIHYSGPFKDGK